MPCCCLFPPLLAAADCEPRGAFAQPAAAAPLLAPRDPGVATMSAGSGGKIRPIMVKAHTRPLTMVKYNREGDLLLF